MGLSEPREKSVVLVFVLLAVLAGGVQGCVQKPDWQGPVRHVVLISLDTTRADSFGCYGNRWMRTPRIDALAGESLLFSDFVTVVPTTLASHTTLFTGNYPHTHGVPRNGFMVNSDNVMLTEVLKETGFHTAGFIGSFALDSRFAFAQGFDHYDETFDFVAGMGAASVTQRYAGLVTDSVIDYLERADIPRNLFLFVHYFDPHEPYAPPPPYDMMYAPPGDTGVEDSGSGGHIELPDWSGVHPEVRKILRNYAGEVSYMDEQLGRLLDYLEQNGILDEALLVVTSDHGENLGEHEGHVGHGWTTYQTTMRAVGMIRLPGALRGGTRVPQPMANIDILPTLLTYLGLPLPEGIEGMAFDLNESHAFPAERTRFGEATRPREEVETDRRWYNLRKERCVWKGQFKYVQKPYQGTEALYDLSSDPGEEVNLLVALPSGLRDKAAELKRDLKAWAYSATPLASRFEPSQAVDTEQRLKALGYLE